MKALDNRMTYCMRQLVGFQGFARTLDDGRCSVGVVGVWSVEADTFLDCFNYARFILQDADAINSSCVDDRTVAIQYLHDGEGGGGAEVCGSAG